MYEQHFGLRTMPFRVVPSPSFMFPSDTHEESRARILYGIRENRGFVVVSGAVGLGKTTVLLSVLEELDASLQTALIVHPVNTFADLLRLVCLEFGIETDTRDEVTMLWELNLFLVERLAEGKKCVLMIDEAQNVPLEVLERVRTLSNLQTESSSLLQIVLVGQPELLTHLDDPSLPQLRQRVGVWHEILPLDADETRKYISHRLQLSGAEQPEALISDAVCARVHAIAGGVPRLVNQICDTAMVIAYGAESRSVDIDHVEEARTELRLEPESSTATPVPASKPAEPTRQAMVAETRVEPVAERGTSGGRRSWLAPLAAAAVLILLVLAAVRFGILPGWPLSGATAAEDASSAVPGMTSEVRAPEASPNGLTSVDAGTEIEEPERVPARSLPEAWVAASEQLQSWRDGGRIVFSAHLASFRASDGVERFTEQLLAEHPDWSFPLFVETTRGTPEWHRVYAGAFVDRGAALRFARRIKDRGTVGFAKVERLGPGIDEFVPAEFSAPRTSNPGESG